MPKSAKDKQPQQTRNIKPIERQLILHQCLSGQLPGHEHQREWKREELTVAIEQTLKQRYPEREVPDFKKDTILEDIKQMETLMLAPIELLGGGRSTRYKYKDPYYNFFDHIELTPTDAQSLDITMKYLLAKTGYNPLYVQLYEFLSRLQQRLGHDYPELKSGALQFEHKPPPFEPMFFDTCLRAIVEQRPIRVIYQKFDADEETEHEILPTVLKEYQKRWYLFSQHCKKERMILLSLDRVLEIDQLPPDAYPDLKPLTIDDVNNYLKARIGVSGLTAQPEEITFWCDASQLPYLHSRPLHSSQRYSEQNEAGAVIKLYAAINYELIHTLLSHGSAIRVLGPQTLVDQYHAKLQQMLRRNSGS